MQQEGSKFGIMEDKNMHMCGDKLTQEEINWRKYNAEIRKLFDAEYDRHTCMNCGKNGTVHSHSIPRFIIEYISEHGKLVTFGGLNEGFGHRDTAGLKNAGTFRGFCSNCDSKLFKDYENECILESVGIDKNALRVIALKNLDYSIYDENMIHHTAKIGLKNIVAEVKDQGKKADYKLVKRMKNEKIIVKNIKDQINISNLGFRVAQDGKIDYTIIKDIILNHRVPIALQFCYVPSSVGDDTYNNCSTTDMVNETIHICVFPLQKCTRILVFGSNKRSLRLGEYDKMIDSDNELKTLNIEIFRCCTSYFINPLVYKLVHKPFKQLYKYIESIDTLIEKLGAENVGNIYEKAYAELPNLLSKRYSL